MQLFNHVPNAREMAIVERVEWAGSDAVATMTADLQARGAARVGLIGPFPYQTHTALLAATERAGLTLVDVTQAFRRLRLVKSAEEIVWTERGAAMCDAAIEALVRGARPGMTEHALVALAESAYREQGGQTTICFLTSGPMSGGGRIVPAQHPSGRRLRAGDAITLELSAGVGGYTGQVLRTIAVGADPPAAFRRLHEVAELAFERIVEVIRPGARASDLLEAARCIDDAGLTVCDDVVHGYGGGYLPPVLRTPATQHGPVPDLELRQGMFLVVQPNVVAADGPMGVQTGELVMVTESGSRSLHSAPRGLLRTRDG